ncbi:hypothetical protein CONCODRAFT_79346 [Conidiobolus coronatus NRRL 28638]|uniref:Uncharacterized protein n=1 Tax=Conidiobolus coronatus (strain ATCC 28846 / CBS 209.66 / NRRL 28638) TaxID=796925 RepID=A0A137P394_CONC2|nr:hypothetical protein CONCODRAFT_79346 [Conidiobolus coronatus NRRL 28638]|eukprot:KXN69374.1 hypothetical protein CONCODRAFT_79346 [Conidiobolus coronatus NRRL 28638]
MFSNLFLSPLLKNNIDLLKKGHLSNSFSDKTVFSAVREQLGGKVRLIFAENTQIPNSQLNAIRVALSSQVIPYYNFDYVFGWTLLASSFDYENRDYTLAGSPIGHLEVKLRNSNISPLKVQDEPYPRGELLIRSLGLSSNVELTEDGWYPTNTFFEMENSGAFKYLGNTFELIPTDGPNSPDFMAPVSAHYLSNRYVLDVKLEHLPHNALPVVDFDMSLSGLASTARYQGLRLKVIPRVEALPGLVQAQYKLTDGSGLPAVEELLLEELIHIAREKKLPRALWPSRVKLITLEDAVGHI